MKQPTETALPIRNVAPLAREADGTIIELPAGAACWRIRRHTGGRPRIILGVDKQPLQLPLDVTIADIEDMLGPGTYRLDVFDGNGNALGATVPVSVGAIADEAPSEANGDGATTVVPTVLPASGSDVRLVLEANVRAMQAAFTHNQRTLEMGFRMAETLRDGVRVLADAQTEWIKSLAGAKGYLRNAAMVQALPAAPAAPANDDDDSDEDDDDYEPEPPAPRGWADILAENLAPLAAPLATHYAAKIMSPKAPEAGAGGAKTSSPGGGIWDKARELVDWRYAAEKAAAKRAKDANPSSDASDGSSVPSRAAAPSGFMAMLANAPPELMSKVMAARRELSADEQAKLFAVLQTAPPDALPALAANMMALPVDRLIVTLREIVSEATPQSADRDLAKAE